MICHFCEDKFNRNRELGLPTKESVVYEDNNIYVMPDICPLAVGHMLIITKQHFQGYANAGNSVLSSVEKFLHYYEEKIGDRDYTIFEHGAVLPYTAGSSVDHAHIHIVPFELEMHELLKSSFVEYTRRNLEELKEYAQEKQPYLFYKIRRNEKGYVYKVGGMESQFLRKTAAELIRQKEYYDWKENYTDTQAYMDFCYTLAWWNSLDYPMPFKWKKKLILEKYGLSSYKELLNEVHRFKANEKGIVLKILEKVLEKEDDLYSRLVLVPMGHQYKLPNYIVTKWEDLVRAENFMTSAEGIGEIWHHIEKAAKRDLVNTSGNSCYCCIAGRISYSWTNFECMEIIEMVSGSSPRQLEKYSVGNNITDYLYAVKIRGDATYKIENIHAGVYYKNTVEWIKCFKHLEEKLEKYRGRLYELRQMISQHEVYSLSLDFVMKKGELSFLDWDTSNDSEILRDDAYKDTFK